MLDQYKNAGNPLAHYDGTAEEIAEQCEGGGAQCCTIYGQNCSMDLHGPSANQSWVQDHHVSSLASLQLP